jgi:hypothetical protein
MSNPGEAKIENDPKPDELALMAYYDQVNQSAANALREHSQGVPAVRVIRKHRRNVIAAHQQYGGLMHKPRNRG